MNHRRDLVLRLAVCFAVAFAATLTSNVGAQAPGSCTTPPVVTNLGGGCGNPAPVLSATPPAIGSDLTVTLESDFPFAPMFIWGTLGEPTPFVIPTIAGSCSIYYDLTQSVILILTVTDANGDVSITYPLPNAPYLVGIVSTLQGRVWAPPIGPLGSDHFADAIRLELGCPVGEIGDTVYCDPNDNGVQDPGEPGIPGVVVNLQCASGFSATAVTDSDGKYLFQDLVADDCTVTVDTTTVPADKIPGTNCPTSVNVSLAPGQSFLDADFCFRNTAEIGDTVFCDMNGNGVQDSNDPGIEGMTVVLNCAVSGISATTTTGPDGSYLFENLPGDEDCTVTVDTTTAPPDKVPGFNCPTEIVVPLLPGQSFLDADFCFVVCNPCDGGVTDLTLRYLGDVAGALIEVENGSLFSGTVEPGETFSFSGISGSSIDLTVNGGAASNIHTSCSQPIGPGIVFGDFEVVAGVSEDGGALCTPTTCELGKPCSLLMQYTGEDCSATSTTQSPDKVSCSGDPMMAAQVMILSTDDSNPFENNPLVFFTGTVDLGETFTIEALLAGEDKLKSATFVHIFDLAGNLLQSVEFHTSCSQPLELGDQFGAVKLLDFTPEGQCPIPAGADNCDFLGDPQVLTMTYTGEGCSATATTQSSDKVSCSGDPMMAAQVMILSTDEEDPTDTGAKVWFSGVVSLGSTFDIDATNEGDNTLPSVTFIHAMDLSGNLLQTVEFHTSCSQPLIVGEQFGAFVLSAFAAAP